MARRTLAARFLSGVVGLTAFAGNAAPPAPAIVPDWIVSHNARQALWNAPELSELNLGVRVRSGEALVWGPVPTDDFAAEAVARLRLVSGVQTVVSELYILPADDLLRQKLRHAPIKPPPVTAFSTGTEALPARLERPIAVRPIPSRTIDLVEEIRTQQRRFRNLTVEVSNGIVTVSGTVERPGDAMEFAEAVRRLPGVSNVVLRVER